MSVQHRRSVCAGAAVSAAWQPPPPPTSVPQLKMQRACDKATTLSVSDNLIDQQQRGSINNKQAQELPAGLGKMANIRPEAFFNRACDIQ